MCRSILLVHFTSFHVYVAADLCVFIFFFFNDTATTEIYTLSLHDALPIFHRTRCGDKGGPEKMHEAALVLGELHRIQAVRSEEHTSELQSQSNIVCRLLLEKKKLSLKQSATLPEILTRRLTQR